MDDDDRPDEGDDAGEPIGDQWNDAATIDDTGGWQLTDAEIALLTDEDRAAYLAELEEYEAALERTAPFKWELVDNPKQMLAHFLAPKVDTLFYGGAAGGGKSEFLCWHAHELSLRYPGHHSLLLRTKLPELRRSLIRRMETRFVQLGIRRTVKLRRLDNLTAFYYPNGSIIEFGFAASDDDVAQFLSAEYDMIGFDEGTKFSPYSIQMISSRARTDRRKSRMGVRPHVILCSNPGGRAHTYLKKLIIGPSERGASVAIYDAAAGVSVENVLEGETRLIEQLPMPTVETVEAFDDGHVPGGDRLSVAFIQAFHRDNPHLDKGYVGRLRALPDTERRQQELGDWDAFDGKAFPDFDWETHVVDYFDPPAHWRRATGADYGWGAPAVNLWGAWDQDGVCWIYRESKLIRHTAPEQGRIWKELSVDPEGRREHIEMRLADRSTHASNGIGAPVAVQWRNGGWPTQPADNARIPGWANVHAYLEITDRQPEPKVRIMRSCPYLIETLATIQADPKKPEDVDTDADDHAADALRYMLQFRPIRMKRRTAEIIDDGLDDISRRVQTKVARLLRTKNRRG